MVLLALESSAQRVGAVEADGHARIEHAEAAAREALESLARDEDRQRKARLLAPVGCTSLSKWLPL